MEHGTEIHARMALYDRDGYFAGEGYEKLGGMAVFWHNADLEKVSYGVKLFLNPHTLGSTKIPENFINVFQGWR